MHRRWMGLLAALILCACAACATAETGTVTASALVLREGPDLSRAMLGEIPNGAVLELLSYENGWYYVEYEGTFGYVSGRYVRVSLPAGETATLPPIVTPVPLPAGTLPPNLSLPQLSFTGENNPGYPFVMKPGDMGNSVIDLQVTLQSFGYAVTADGQYGYDTQAAVMRMQREMGIDDDGIVGAQTRRLIGNTQPDGSVELLDWWRGGNVAFARLTTATVVDVRTGLRFQVSRYGGDNHCDTEPLTAQDSAILLSILGGEWTWERRPVWLEVNGRVIAASINSMPHQGQHITNNGFDGHFCMHFLNSHTHETDRIDEEHAACIREAWNARDRYSP